MADKLTKQELIDAGWEETPDGKMLTCTQPFDYTAERGRTINVPVGVTRKHDEAAEIEAKRPERSGACVPTGLTVTLLPEGVVGTTLPQPVQYQVSAVTKFGEAKKCTKIKVVPVENSCGCRITWNPVAGATSYKVYGQWGSGEERFLDEVTDCVYVDGDEVPKDRPVAVTSEVPTTSDTPVNAVPTDDAKPTEEENPVESGGPDSNPKREADDDKSSHKASHKKHK